MNHKERSEKLAEALRQIATVEANDPEEVAAGLSQTQSYTIAVNALAQWGTPPEPTGEEKRESDTVPAQERAS